MAEAVTDRSDKAKRPISAVFADSLRLPILDLEAVDASKRAQICADENQAARERLTGDQDIVGPIGVPICDNAARQNFH